MSLLSNLAATFRALKRAGMTTTATVAGIGTADVLFDAPGVLQFDDGYQSTYHTIAFPVDALPGLAKGASAVVGAATFEVRKVMPVEDGNMIVAEMSTQ